MSITRTTSMVLAALAAVILVWPVAGSAADAPAAANIALNGGAEKGKSGKLPEGWGRYENTPAEVGATDKEFYTGKRCAFMRITGFGDDGVACTGLAVGKTGGYSAPKGISVKPNTTYHFSFCIAGAGFKRKISVKPWGFNEDGKGRDRSIKGISVLPTLEWKRYTGSFKTKAEMRKMVLMFSVYGREHRDVKQGGVFYVDDVYLGEAEPPAPVKGSLKIKPPKLAAEVKGEGYSPLKPGTVRIWDTNRKYKYFYVDFVAWKDRAGWSQVPYGKTGHKFKGEAVMENDNMFLFLHSGKQFGPILYAKLGKGKHSVHNALYRVWWEDGGRVHHYDGQPRQNRIEKNTATEAVIVNVAGDKVNAGRYRIPAGRHWLEITPVKGKKADETGYHGEARVMLVPDYKDGNDYVMDSAEDRYKTYGRSGSPDQPVHPTRRGDTARAAKDRPHWGSYPMTPPDSKMLIDLQMTGGQFMWTMTYPSWKVARPYLNWAPGGRLDKWPPWRSGSLKRRGDAGVWSAPYGGLGNQKIIVGVINSPGCWHPEIIGTPLKGGKVDGKPVQAGEKYTCKWKAPYAGKWRMTARFRDDKAPGKGRYYSKQVTMDKGGEFVFTCPVAGKLEHIILYLYDRTAKTPAKVGTPMDVYRETIKTKQKGKESL